MENDNFFLDLLGLPILQQKKRLPLRVLEVGASDVRFVCPREHRQWNVLAIDPRGGQGIVAKKLEEIDGQFDLIVDSHALHCLRDGEEIKNMLWEIFQRLPSAGGVYLAELMCPHPKMDLGHHFFFDSPIIYEKYSNRPLRIVLKAHQWEEIFLDSGFRLEYFFLPFGREFTLTKGGAPQGPDALHIIATKN